RGHFLTMCWPYRPRLCCSGVRGQSAMPAVEPWLSHLPRGELEGGRRLNRRSDLVTARYFTTARRRCAAFSRLAADVRGTTGDRLRRDPDQQILDAIVVDDAVGRIAHDVEVELAGDSAADDAVVGSALSTGVEHR